MQIIARTLSAVLSVYMILLMIRVMLTWFRAAQTSQLIHYLAAVTDPYLNWFRRFSVLRFGMIDFSPIIAFVILGFVINICNSIATYGKVYRRNYPCPAYKRGLVHPFIYSHPVDYTDYHQAARSNRLQEAALSPRCPPVSIQ